MTARSSQGPQEDGDLGEPHADVAATYPDVVKRTETLMAASHTPSPVFPLPAVDTPPR